MDKKTGMQTLILCLLAAVICVSPLLLIDGSEFAGADGAAQEAIAEVNAEYVPWFEPIWSPPGSETESLLFALQAALGAGVLCYGLGYLKGQSQNKKDTP